MAPKKETTETERAQMKTLRDEGYSYRYIAHRMHLSPSTMYKCVQRHEQNGNFKNTPGRGRKKKLSISDEKYLKVSSLRNRRKSSKELTRDLEEATGKRVSPRLVRKTLTTAGLGGYVAVRKPMLRKRNKHKRLIWARIHKTWTPVQWRKVMFTDEKKFELVGNSLRQYVRRRRGERYKSDCVLPTVKHGAGSLQVWGSITYSGVGHLYKITDNLTAPKYKQILIHHAVSVGKSLIGNNFVFQHDNDPKHTARIIKRYLENKKRDGSLTVLNWPAQSPDMNIIEQVWTYMEKEKVKRAPVNLQQLWEVLQDIWRNISVEFIQRLYDSVPRRVNEVCKAKGFHTKY